MSTERPRPSGEDLALRAIRGGAVEETSGPRSGTVHQGEKIVAAGELPVWFATVGLELLRQGEFQKAREYYKTVAEQKPDKPEGWMGLGATYIGTGEYKNAAQFLARGLELVDIVPMGAIAAEARPGDSRMFIELAQRLAELETQKSLMAAMLVLDECMKTPTTPSRVYRKANGLKLKYRDWLDVVDKPELSALKRKAEMGELLSTLARYVLIVAVIAGAGFGGWRAYRTIRVTGLMKGATLDFVDAWHMETLGSGALNTSKDVTEPYDLYLRAFNQFRDATRVNPDHFMAQYMTARCGQAAVDRAHSQKLTKKVTDRAVDQLAMAARKAREKAKSLDPSGALTREADAEVGQMLKQ